MKELSLRNQSLNIAIVAALLMVTSTRLCAQGEEWNIQLEPMYMGVLGNDTKTADIVTLTRSFGSGLFTPAAKSAVNLDMDGDFAIRGELEYRRNGWGLGVSGWGFDADSSEAVGPVYSGSRFNFNPVSLKQVILWDETLTPPPSGNEPFVLNIQAKNDLEIWNTDFYAIRTLFQDSTSQLDLTFGAKIGNLDNKRQESINNAFFATTLPGIVVLSLGNAVHTSRSNFDAMAGPSLGFQGQVRKEKHKVEGFLNQSVLIGQVEQNASFQLEKEGLFGPTFSSKSFSRKETDAVPITEIKLQYSYELIEHLSFGLGVFASIWWNVPLAPEFKRASTYSSNPDTWKIRENTLTFLGGMGSISYRF